MQFAFMIVHRMINRNVNLHRGTRMKKITTFLSNDHGRIFGAFEDYTRMAVDQLTERKQAMNNLKQALDRHSSYVEGTVVPAVKDRLDEDTKNQIKSFMEEGHQSINTRIQEMEKKLESGTGDTTNLEEELRAAMNEHFEREEKILYPIFDEHLSDEEKKCVLEQMKGIIPDEK